jgi:hypothetical protein
MLGMQEFPHLPCCKTGNSNFERTTKSMEFTPLIEKTVLPFFKNYVNHSVPIAPPTRGLPDCSALRYMEKK